VGIGANIRKIPVRYLPFIQANCCLVNYLKRPISLKLAPMAAVGASGSRVANTTKVVSVKWWKKNLGDISASYAVKGNPLFASYAAFN
jgi:hypothetical protein